MTDNRKKPWRGRLVPVAIVLAATALVALVASMPSPRDEAKVVEPPPVNVSVETVRVLPEVAETFDLPGSVEPNRVVKVSAEVPGRIEAYGTRAAEVRWLGRVYPQGQAIDEGEPVAAGQLLVRLNSDILEAERERVRAQSEYDRSEYERLLEVQRRGATTAREVYEAQTKMQVSRAMLSVADEQLKRGSICSPIAGILNRMAHEVGEYVLAGTQIAEIVEIDPAKVAVDVPERDVACLSVGQQAPVGIEPDGRWTDGRITYIGAVADPMTRSSRVEITIANPDNRLHSGQIVRVRLRRAIRANVVMIPLKAVMPLEQGHEVFVAADGVAASRQVKMGFIRQDRVMVEGLAPGEQLIVEGHRLIGAGQRVRVIGDEGAGDRAQATAGSDRGEGPGTRAVGGRAQGPAGGVAAETGLANGQ